MPTQDSSQHINMPDVQGESAIGVVQKKAILLTIARIINTLTTVAATMIVTRMLDTVAYATYKQTFLAFNFLLPFMGLGLSQGLYFFLPQEKKRFRAICYESYVVYGLIGCIFAVIIALGGNHLLAARFNNPEIAPLMLWQIPFALISLMTNCTAVIMNIRNKISLFIRFSMISTFFSTVALIIVLLFVPTAKGSVIVVSATNSVSGVISIMLCISILPHDDKRIKWKEIVKIVSFSIPIGISGMIGTITAQMDTLFVASMSQPEDYAVYQVGAHELPFIAIFLSSITSAMLPEMRKSISNGDYENSMKLYRLTADRVASCTLPIMCFLLVWGGDFVEVMYSSKYKASTDVFLVYLLYFLVRVSVTGPLFTALGMNKYLLAKTIVSCILNAVLTYAFIRFWGPIGAAIGTIISGWVIALTMIFPVLSKKLNCKMREFYPIKTALMVMLGGFVAAGISYALFQVAVPITEALPSILCGGIIYLIVFFFFSRTLCKRQYAWVWDILAKRRMER